MKQYEPQGLKIVAVYDGRKCSVRNVKDHIKRQKIGYPLLFDAGGRMRTALKARAYPMAYLVGRDGKVQWEGVLGKHGRSSVRAFMKQSRKK